MSTVKPGSKTPTLRAAVWPFVVVIMIQMVFAGFSMATFAAIRSWVMAADFWSRNEQAAAFDLLVYASSHEEQTFQDYRHAMQTPLAYLEGCCRGSGWKLKAA